MLTVRMNWTKWCVWFLFFLFTVAVTLKIRHAVEEVGNSSPVIVTPKPTEKTSQ